MPKAVGSGMPRCMCGSHPAVCGVCEVKAAKVGGEYNKRVEPEG